MREFAPIGMTPGGAGAPGPAQSGSMGGPSSAISSGTAAQSGPTVGIIEDPMIEGMGECGQIEITPVIMYEPGNLLIVFDRSISMSTVFDQASNSNRLDNAKHAIMTALEPLVCAPTASVDVEPCTDDISVALLTFPTYDGVNGLSAGGLGGLGGLFGGGGTQMDPNAMPEDPMMDPVGIAPAMMPDAGMGAPPAAPAALPLSCTVDDLASDEQINWQGVTAFYNAFPGYWDARMTINTGPPLFPAGDYPLVYGTPISVAFARANEALNAPNVVGNKAVLFLTDGEETGECTGGADPVQMAATWNQMGIPTHVVSLAPPQGEGVAFNNAVASNGGTGQPVNPSNSAQLTEEISNVVLETRGEVSCKVTIDDAMLTNPDLACEKGAVYVGPTKVPCDQANKAEGFWVSDVTSFEVVGSYCTRLQESGSLRADFPCELIVE